jgi:kynurenine formamidase
VSESGIAVTDLPRYDDLPIDAGKPPGSAWGVWGDDDEVGSINLLTEERVKVAAECVRKGRVFSLNWDVEQPDPPLYNREPLQHTVIALDSAYDDYYDNFYPQQSSQWDALCHVGHPDFGYYNGVAPAAVTGRPGSKNGIEHWARRGIAGRGVLLDVARQFEIAGRPIDASSRVELTAADLREVAEAQGTELRTGDILLIRTGWIAWYEDQADDLRAQLAQDSHLKLHLPGLAAGEETLRFLWDAHLAGVATDTPAFEAWPHPIEVGPYLHFDVIALLGLAIGEMWYLDALAGDCAEDGVYEFLLTSAPMNKVGGVGSPPNAIAIK